MVPTGSVEQQSPYPTRLPGAETIVARCEPVVHGTGEAGPFSIDELDLFDHRGFVRIDRLIDEDDLSRLEGAINRIASDPMLVGDERLVREPDGPELRSVFAVHTLDPVIASLAADPRLRSRAEQILGSEVYVHQSRLNMKPGFRGKEFYWHSDFETWHAEDGMPGMRAVSLSIALTPNRECNGSLLMIPGSHRRFVGCAGETPQDHYRESLRAQRYGVPTDEALALLVAEGGIEIVTGDAGSAVMFDCNVMHGSNGNISPFDRRNLFIVYNSVENTLVEPFAAPQRRPEFIANREFRPLR